MAWSLQTFVGLETLSAAELNQLRENLTLLDQHTHSGDPGDGSVDVFFGLNYVQVIPFVSESNSGWATLTQRAVAFTATMDTDDAATGHSISFRAALRTATTWRVDLLHAKGPDYGIITVDVDGSVIGTIDAYAATETYDNESSITGATIGSLEVNQPCTVTLTISSKNASSTGYRGKIQFMAFRLV